MDQSCSKLFTDIDNGLSSAYAVFSACSGLLSILSSTTIIHIISRGGKKKRCGVQNRLLICMSVVDIFYSTALSLSYIPSPRGECSLGYGTVSTCNAQGFFVQLGAAIPLYITMMSLHSLLSIAYNVPEEVAKKYEATMHAVCILPPLAMATTGSIGRVFVSVSAQCWLLEPSLYEDNCEGNCYSWSKDAGKILLITTISMAAISQVLMYSFLFKIYLVIRERAVRMRRFTFTPSGNQIRLRREPSSLDIAANEAAKQALLYVSGHVATFIWTLLYLFVPTQDETFHSMLYIGTGICAPLHGFFNFLTYIRPRFLILRRKRKELSFLNTMKLIICASEEQAPMRRKVVRRASFPLASSEEIFTVSQRLPHTQPIVRTQSPIQGQKICESDEDSEISLDKKTLEMIELAAISFGKNLPAS